MDATVSDNALALQAGKGDGDAFRQLLERHYDGVFRLAFRFLAHREEAEDLAQEVCVSLPAKLKSFRGEAAFSTWLYRVVLNRVRDEQRKHATATRLMSEYADVDALSRDEADAARREAQWLSDMMAQLPDDLRETAILVVGEGMSQAQAAEVLGVKEGTVAWRMSELKKALREMAREEA